MIKRQCLSAITSLVTDLDISERKKLASWTATMLMISLGLRRAESGADRHPDRDEGRIWGNCRLVSPSGASPIPGADLFDDPVVPD
jgi:hypothetical protein